MLSKKIIFIFQDDW